MEQESFALEVRWSREPCEPVVWRATGDGSQVLVTLPDGSSTSVAQSADPLEVLEHLLIQAPGINRIPAMQVTEVNCSPNVEALLPLWLTADEDVGPGPDPDQADIDLITDTLGAVPCGSAHVLRVNGSIWAAVKVSDPKQQSTLVFTPLRGSGAEGLFAETYGLFSFTERGGMISGLALSAVGLLTPKVLAIVNVLDDDAASIRIQAPRDPVTDLQTWIRTDDLAQQLRPLWDLSKEDADFIEWGFLQLAKSGNSSIELVGLTDVCEDPDGEGLGMGLTTTAAWTFESDLPPWLLREAVAGVTDRRPGLRQH